MKTFKQHLEESTFSINKDVDLIYRSVFKDFIDNLKRGKVTPLKTVSFKSDQLQSADARKANELNPVTIEAGLNKDGSYYAPLSNKIVLSFNTNVLDILKQYDSIEDALKSLAPSEILRFQEELNGNAVRYTIFHELSHWIDDTLHGKHLSKTVKRAVDIDGREKKERVLSRGTGSTTSSDYEINAQIHSIKRARLQNKKLWDRLTFDQMLNLVPSVHVVNRNLRGKQREGWRKKMFRRMAREGLLGANMR